MKDENNLTIAKQALEGVSHLPYPVISKAFAEFILSKLCDKPVTITSTVSWGATQKEIDIQKRMA